VEGAPVESVVGDAVFPGSDVGTVVVGGIVEGKGVVGGNGVVIGTRVVVVGVVCGPIKQGTEPLSSQRPDALSNRWNKAHVTAIIDLIPRVHDW